MPDARLYETDFHAWALHQAGALRRLAAARPNLGSDIDWAEVAEEIEDMGKEQAAAVDSALVRIIEHLLKLQVSPAEPPRRGWCESVLNARDLLAERLARNPSLETPTRLADALSRAWIRGRRLAVQGLRMAGEGDAAALIPDACPFTLDQIRDFDWWPVRADRD